MPRNRRQTLAEPPPDPFGECRPPAFRERQHLLGGEFEFATDSARLLDIVRRAYAGVPAHRFAGAVPRFKVRLVLLAAEHKHWQGGSQREPPQIRNLAAPGILGGAMGRATFVAVTPEQHSALIVVSRDMLRYPYHIRYELLEFAVYLLASRAQRLIPLHAACIGQGKRGLLLIGPSGSGKSTLVLHGLISGLDFLAEDSVLVDPQGLRASGVANFLHLRRDSLRFLATTEHSRLSRSSVVIRRRSGVEKLEIDLRRTPFRLAAAPLQIGAVLFLSSKSAGRRPLLAPLTPAEMLRRLERRQRYAAQQPRWSHFREQVARLPAFELRRGAHPHEGVEAMQALLAGTTLLPTPSRPGRPRNPRPQRTGFEA